MESNTDIKTSIYNYAISFYDNVENPKTVKCSLYSFDGYDFYYQIKYDDKMSMVKQHNNYTYIELILLDILNNSKLWTYKAKYNPKVSLTKINIELFINNEYIDEYINKSVSLKILVLFLILIL